MLKLMIRITLEPFRLFNKLLELVVMNYPTSFGNHLRRYYLQARGAKIGRGSTIYYGSTIKRPDLLVVGENSAITSGCFISLGPDDAKLIIGNASLIGPQTFVRNMNHVFQDLHKPLIDQGYVGKDIVIGNDVWIGARSILLPGAEIEDHCVVAAGSVVLMKIPPYSVVAGHPARVVKKRIETDAT